MDNKTLAKLLMEEIHSKSFEQLVAEVEQAEPTGLGEALGADYIFSLLDDDEFLNDITVGQSGCHRFAATDYLVASVYQTASFSTGSFGSMFFGGQTREVDSTNASIAHSNDNYALAA